MTQIISLSDRAAERIKEIISKDQKSLGVRVGVKSGGCAGMAYIMEYAKEKKENEVKELVEDFLQMIKESPEMKTKIITENEKTKLMSLSGVKQYPMRVKCATLAWHTLTSAMNNSQEETNTEKFD